MAVGIVLVLLGVWLVARTVTHDDEHKTLVNRILDLG
jgi:hypothetical protein